MDGEQAHSIKGACIQTLAVDVPSTHPPTHPKHWASSHKFNPG